MSYSVFRVNRGKKLKMVVDGSCDYGYGNKMNGRFVNGKEYEFWSDNDMFLTFFINVHHENEGNNIKFFWNSDSPYNYVTLHGTSILFSNDQEINDHQHPLNDLIFMNIGETKRPATNTDIIYTIDDYLLEQNSLTFNQELPIPPNFKLMITPRNRNCPFEGSITQNNTKLYKSGYFDRDIQTDLYTDEVMYLLCENEVQYKIEFDRITVYWENTTPLNHMRLRGTSILKSSKSTINNEKYDLNNNFDLNFNVYTDPPLDIELFYFKPTPVEISQNIIIYGINELIKLIGRTTLDLECSVGTGNDVNVICEDKLSFSGTLGNKTSDGYYINYGLFIKRFVNTFAFTFDLPGTTYVIDNAKKTYTVPISGKYNDVMSVETDINGDYQVYIPEVTIPAVVVGGVTITPEITTPSSYHSSLSIDYNIKADIHLTDIDITTFFTFTISPYDYSEPGKTTLHKIYIPGLETSFFLSEISIDSLELDVKNLQLDANLLGLDLDLNLNGNILDEITEMLNSILVDLLNSFIKTDNVYEFYG